MRGPFAFLALMLLGGLLGRSAPLDREPLATIEVGLASEHVFRGLERAGAAGRVALAGQAGAWRARFVGVVPLDDNEPAEWRAAGGWGWSFGERLEVEVELAGTRFSPGPLLPVRDTLETGLTARWVLPREVALELGAYHDFQLEADTAEAALEYGFPLTRIGAYLDLRAFLGWSDGRDWRPRAASAPVSGSYGYLGAAAELPYRVGANTTLVVGARYSEAWNVGDAGVFAGSKGRRNLAAEIGVRFDF